MNFNRISIFIFGLLCLSGWVKGQSLFLDGADVWVGGSAVLYVGGTFENAAGGTVDNSGQIVVGGDFLNNAGNRTFVNGSPGMVSLSGDTQTVAGADTTEFYDLTLAGTGTKYLGHDELVTNVLDLSDRELNTVTYNIGVQNASPAAVTRTTGYVSADFGGGLARLMALTSPYLFPVGSSALGYRPVELTPGFAAPTGFLVRMADVDPTNEGFDRTVNDGSFCDLIPDWYHSIQRLAPGAPVTVTNYFDDSLDAKYSKMGQWKVAPEWQDIPTAVLTSNNSPVLSSWTAPGWTDFTYPAWSMGGDTFSISLMSASDTICFGDTAVFTATAGFLDYDFYVNQALVQAGQSNVYMDPNLNTGDTVRVVVRDSSGCTDEAYRVVVVGFVPVTWINQTGVNQSNDTLFQTFGSNTWASAGATGQGNLDPFTDGTLRHVVHNLKDFYYIGLSNDGASAANISIEHAFYVYKKLLRVRESSGTNVVVGPLAMGDTLEISRVGTNLIWTQNGNVVYSTPVNDGVSLRPDISIFKANSFVTNVWTDFCSGNPPSIPFTVQSQLNYNSCTNDPSGQITVFPNGGTPPYSYVWNTGDTTSTVDSLSLGFYSVTVSDNIGNVDVLDFNMYNSITWTDLVGATSGSDTLTRTLSGNGWGTSGARSEQVLLPGNNGDFSHVVHRTDKFYYIGLSASQPSVSQFSMDYAFYVAKSALRIREEGSGYFQTVGTIAKNDTLRVARVGSNIEYYKNSTLLKTTSATAAEPLFVDATIFNQGVSLYDNFTTFCNDSLPPDSFSLGFMVNHADCYQNNGSITALPNGGTPPYSYDWSTGDTTPSITGQMPGDYSVIVTDQLNNSDTLDLEIYANTIWEGFIGSAVQGGSLVRTAPQNGWGQSGARSDNKILNGNDGKVVHIVNSTGYNYYIGLSDADPDASQFTIDYSYYNYKGNLYIREEKTGFFQNYGTVAVGDTLVIERRISSMYWYHNGTQLRSIGISPTETLRVDVSLFTNNTTLTDVYVDFCDTVPGQKNANNAGQEPMSAFSEQEVMVYPNPNSGSFTVEMTGLSEEDLTLSVVDLAGRILFTTRKEHSGGLFIEKLDVQGVTKGIYMLKIQSSQGESLHKLIIE